MLICSLVFAPFLSGILCLTFQYFHKKLPRLIALLTFSYIFVTLLVLFYKKYSYKILNVNLNSNWDIEFFKILSKKLGINIYFGCDGITFIMLSITSFLGFISIFYIWNIKYKNQGVLYLNFMWLIGSIIGIFLSLDLFLFFCFWDFISIPMYFLILIWGFNNKNYYSSLKNVSNKFFIYAKFSSFFLLLGILGLVYNYYILTKLWCFNYNLLINTPIKWNIELILMLCFFLSFAIKIPLVPFHSWMIDFHTLSPVSGFLDIIGILLKTSVYGLLRFNIPLFPISSKFFSSIVFFLGFINIFYCSLIAFKQKDLKKIIAYGSISNMGFIMLSLYSMNFLSLEGVIIQVVTHACSTAALFLLIGNIYSSLGTRKINKISGFWYVLEYIPILFLFFCMANLGVPFTGNFTGEFLMLIGIFLNHPIISLIASFSLVFIMIYSLYMMKFLFFGIFKINLKSVKKTYCIEKFSLLCLLLLIIIIGIYPKEILDTSYSSIMNIYKNFNCLTKY